jgi:hypothetical protein
MAEVASSSLCFTNKGKRRPPESGLAVVVGVRLPAGSAPATIRTADAVTAWWAPRAPIPVTGRPMNHRGVLRLRFQARGALGLRASQSNGAERQRRCSQSHHDLSHQLLLDPQNA